MKSTSFLVAVAIVCVPLLASASSESLPLTISNGSTLTAENCNIDLVAHVPQCVMIGYVYLSKTIAFYFRILYVYLSIRRHACSQPSGLPVVATAYGLPVMATETKTNFTMMALNDTNQTGAVCLDGSPGVFGISPGKSEKDWLVHLEGGGWCFTAQDCAQRSLHNLGRGEVCV